MFKTITNLWRGGKPSDDQRHWDQALRILQHVDPNLVLHKLPWWKRQFVRVRFWFPHRAATDAWLKRKRKPSEVSAGLAAPLQAKDKESRAFEIQVRVLEHAIQLRKALYRGELSLDDMPENEESEKELAESAARGFRRTRNANNAAATVRALMVRIQDGAISERAADDIIADYWNKLATIAWEAAQLAREKRSGEPYPWLERAREYIAIALKDRPTWTPAQLNLARITAMEGERDKALDILERILGEETKEAPPPTAPVRIDDSSAIANLILKMAIGRHPADIAHLIQRNYAPLSKDTLRKVTEALAGKVDAELLVEIFSNLQN
jgi:hypothetical protein